MSSSTGVPALTVKLSNPSYLASNVKVPVYASAVKPRSLTEIPNVRTQETLIANDLLSILLGYEGNYVRYSEKYDSTRVQDRIRGPDYKTARHLDVSLKSITKKLATYGKWYSGLNNFVQIYDHPQLGRVNQRLCYEIRMFMKEYQRLVLDFETQFKISPIPVTEMDNIIMQRVANRMAHLYEIANTIHMKSEERTESPSFNSFLEFVRQDLAMTGSISASTDTNKFTVCKGGVVLHIVTERINAFKGDSEAFHFLTRLFDSISMEYVSLLNDWLTEGQFDDLFGEFLIKKNDLPTNIFYSDMEKYWSELYVIKLDGVPDQLLNKDIQHKILATGKYLNIIRQCSGIVSFRSLPDFARLSMQPIESLFAPDLHLKIIHRYKLANKLFLRLLLEGYQLQTLINDLHETFLLNKSFAIDKFLASAFHDLSRDKHSAPTARIQRLYNKIFLSQKPLEEDASISDIIPQCKNFSVDRNNFYELAQEIIAIESFDADEKMRDTESASDAIKRIVSRSLSRRQTSSSGSDVPKSSHEVDSVDQYTIASVNIDMDLPFPINLIIADNYIFEYQLLFKLQMILKFANMATDRTWKEINFSTVWRYRGFHPSVQNSIGKCRALNANVKGFVNAIQTYFNYSIVEENFGNVLKVLELYTHHASKEIVSDQNSSNGRNFLKSFYNGNDVFDKKISEMSNRQGATIHRQVEQRYDDVQELKDKIGMYLNNMLRDAMVTDERLLSCLHNILTVVIHINNYMSRLKKSLVLMDERQFAAFKRDMPERFVDLKVNDELIGTRAASFKQIVDAYTEVFNQAIGDLLYLLRNTDANENHQLSDFATQLEVCVSRK
ncbi:hypothetical_protein [Candidozyma auris]|uniref:hypothetical_protein n=1 Tax=Candidozyma auris TaxID=498019 RepID=UPI000D2654AB|nr:hypothetical_protein [[Candida] auris]QEO23030.1 hypothetical_protein [[Candida] auris]GBL49078.1 hypothetical protein CAJCM15448_13520 [[Candida] auris]